MQVATHEHRKGDGPGHLTAPLGKRGSEQAARRFLRLSWDQDRIRGNRSVLAAEKVVRGHDLYNGSSSYQKVSGPFSGPEIVLEHKSKQRMPL